MLLSATGLLPCLLLSPPADPGLEGMLRAELGFAHRAQAVGYPRAFEETLAEDALTFHPQPVKGRAHYAREPRDRGRLSWYPTWAKISADGAFGFTSGPWQYLPEGGGTALTGHFNSVWRRGPGGWKVLLDVGVPQPTPTLELPLLGGVAAPPTPGPKVAEAVADLDAAFSREAAAKGVAAAYAARAGELRFMRTAEPLRLGPQLGGMADLQGHAWCAEGSGSADAGDLAYTYGTRKDPQGRPQASFIRFWRTEAGRWRLDLDVELPVPPTK